MKALIRAAALCAALLGATGVALAQQQLAEIRVGNTMAYSGPASAYGVIGKLHAAYFKMVNDAGGVNGHRIEYISLDDGYAPPKTVEATRRLVEQDKVNVMFSGLGTPTSLAVRRYLNEKKVPQLFVGGGASAFTDVKNYPYTSPWSLNYRAEAQIYTRYVLRAKPDAKIALLWQNDDFGRDYVEGVRDVLGSDFDRRVVKSVSYDISDPTVDSQVLQLKASGADVLISGISSRAAVQALRKMHDLGWKPMHFISNASTSTTVVLNPAGPAAATGLITGAINKDPSDPRWATDAGMQEYKGFMAKQMPSADANDLLNLYAYGVAKAFMQILKQCGTDFSSGNILKQAQNLREVEIPTLLPGIKVNTSPADPAPLHSAQLQRWDGKVWVPFGPVLSATR